MHFLTTTVLVSVLGAVSQAMPTSVATSIDGIQYITPAHVETVDVLVDGVTKTVNFYGFTQEGVSAVAKRQFYINPDQDKHYDRCGDSSFTSLTSSYSPSVADCKVIVDGVNKRGGYWYARPVDGLKVMTQIISAGSCAFSVKSDDDYGTQIGDTDVRDLINDAITRFAKNGLIGATGQMPCQNDQDSAKTTWTIMHVGN
jgi:Pathogen effector